MKQCTIKTKHFQGPPGVNILGGSRKKRNKKSHLVKDKTLD